MKLQFIEHGKLFIDKTNMRHGRKAPDVSDIIGTVRRRGVIQPLIVKPANADGAWGIVAGARRWVAHGLAAAEGFDHGALACAVLEDGDDAAAIEASLIENVARRDPDEVTQWETFVRLVKEGRDPAEIAETFGMPELMVKRVLALGNLLPRIRDLYRREEIDRTTVRHLTLASKARQREWLAIHDDAEQRTPTGHGLKAWLLGGQSIPARHALFDAADVTLVADLFGEDAYFADAQDFWTRQEEAIEARRAEYLEAGWREVVVVPRGEYFHAWQFEKTPKRKGGRVYIDVRDDGEVTFHEGYVSTKEARIAAKGESSEPEVKPARAEVTANLGTYIDLHRHAATRAVLLDHPGVALRLMVAHAIAGSSLWIVRPEPQATRNDDIGQSVAETLGEAIFDQARLKVLRLMHLSEDEPRVTGGNGDGYGLVGLFLRLTALADEEVMAVLAIVMGETLEAGSPVVDALAAEIDVGMATWWAADDAFFELLRDREVLVAMVADVAGPRIAEANAKEKGKTLKGIIRAHLEGAEGREMVEGWVPRWMAFPPSAYTARGGVGSVAAHERASAARAEWDEVRAATEVEAETAHSQEPATDGASPEVLPPLAA
ncbi:ParB/RepB/Spo0J family partition protein [Novosphingobium sp. JCM 18896]|uniref:ParB/RepB/Spo0J family partition protein n=1 Tax=Novosphingobium sp. JCM 18896 TaxID=2989731 RepID=UPI002223BFEF|nr:ParB N-terminal domain-containing protein [Novosphingobium sp. JCM 18896]MCW1430900.1 ParB N-terminal domain-containing protein [Novosphingobium sp. JCM 18896]